MPLRKPATAGFFVGGESEGFPRLAKHWACYFGKRRNFIVYSDGYS